MKGKKGFQPGHKDRYKVKYKRPVAKKTIGIRPYQDQVDALANIKGLQEKVRKFFDELISGQKG